MKVSNDTRAMMAASIYAGLLQTHSGPLPDMAWSRVADILEAAPTGDEVTPVEPASSEGLPAANAGATSRRRG